MTEDILIYEYHNNYFVVQRSQQGKKPTPETEHQRASENAKLFTRLPGMCTPQDIGRAAFEALDNFDKVSPNYNPWELKELNKELCGWIGTRSINSLNKNSCLVQVVRDEREISVIPYDNHNKDSWYAPMIPEMGFENKVIVLELGVSENELGKSIFKAFETATCHPDKS